MDNFPRTREQFTSMIERNIVPDEVISLRDDSENGEYLLKRWYYTNKEGILRNIFQSARLTHGHTRRQTNRQARGLVNRCAS